MQFKDFAKGIIQKITTSKPIDVTLSHTKFVEEDQLTTREIEALLAPYINDERLIDDESLLQPFIDYLKSRSERIVLTDLNYHVQPHTLANELCRALANQVIIAANQIRYQHRDINQLLMPHMIWSPDGKIKNSVFDLLKAEEALSEQTPKPMTTTLRAFKMSEDDFARLILNQIAKIKQNDAKLALEISAESCERIYKLSELCHHYDGSEKPINRAMLSTYIDFLRKRGREINGTVAAYHINPNTPANRVCEFLADIISLAAYHLNYLNRVQSSLLMITEPENLSEVDAKAKLQKTIIGMVTSREQLLSTLMQLDHDHWNDYLKIFDTTQLIKLVTNGQQYFSAILESNETYQGPEDENKALLYVNFSIYESLRAELKKTHSSFLGRISSFLLTVPSRDEKLSAVKTIKQLIASKLSLEVIDHMLKDPDKQYYQQHHVAFNDGRVNTLMSQLKKAAEVDIENLESKTQIDFRF